MVACWWRAKDDELVDAVAVCDDDGRGGAVGWVEDDDDGSGGTASRAGERLRSMPIVRDSEQGVREKEESARRSTATTRTRTSSS